MVQREEIEKLLIIQILSISDFKTAILVSDMEDKTLVYYFNGSRYVFQYYYPIDLT